MFLLVTDFGVSRIPFLSWDRRKMYNRGFGDVEWGARHAEKEMYENLMEKLDSGYLSYIEEYRNGDNNGRSIGRFTFDFRNQSLSLTFCIRRFILMRLIPVQVLRTERAVKFRRKLSKSFWKPFLITVSCPSPSILTKII